MDRTTKIVFGVVIALLLLILTIGGCVIFFFYKVVDTTRETMVFLKECPLPEEFNFVNDSEPTQENANSMIEWCCANFDGSREICTLLEQQNG